MRKVELISTEPEQGSIVLDDLPAMIGRNRTADVMLTDGDVAQFEAIMDWGDGTLTITDIAGGGISVNGRRITTAGIMPGDRLRVGKSEFLVRYQRGC